MITYSAVPDPDLEISVGGGGEGWSSRPLDIKRGPGLLKKNVSTLWPSIRSKNNPVFHL